MLVAVGQKQIVEAAFSSSVPHIVIVGGLGVNGKNGHAGREIAVGRDAAAG